jgi:ATP-dependent Clp protease adaptor protein ClpS
MKTVEIDMIHQDIDHRVIEDIGEVPNFEDPCKVILYNDNHNSMQHVMECLIKVFGHSVGMAKKIMLEAHKNGKTVAQVEGREEAVKHKQQLESAGITAEVETM